MFGSLKLFTGSQTQGSINDAMMRDHRTLSETPDNPHVNVDLDPSLKAEPGSADPISPTDVMKRQLLPDPVVSSELKAGQQPAANSDPEVIREKKEMQDELQQKVAEKQ
ncbi:hypothetical protein LTR86_003446 [Recurvomyces mirabilis]|nr:hypothetical protein LTR86_003446 [Recurvomyces mirabilis]